MNSAWRADSLARSRLRAHADQGLKPDGVWPFKGQRVRGIASSQFVTVNINMGILSQTPPIPPAFELVVSHLEVVTTELFAAYGIPIRRSPAAHAPSTLSETAGAATIGYVGNHVRGALTILATESTVRAWLGGVGAGEWELGDALGEYSNMLLGRLKGRLLREGFPILLATPTSTTGRTLRLSTPPGQSAWLTFDGPGWQVGVRIDASFDLGFALQATLDQELVVEAGEAILF